MGILFGYEKFQYKHTWQKMSNVNIFSMSPSMQQLTSPKSKDTHSFCAVRKWIETISVWNWNKMVCLFCLKERTDGVSINGASELATNARSIIARHFWFDVSSSNVVFHFLADFHGIWRSLAFHSISQVNLISTSDRYACSNCWSKVETFHNFYVMVEANHQDGPINVGNAKIFANPLVDCEPDTSLKVEGDRLDSYASNYETVYIPSTSYWDDSNRQIEECKDFDNLIPSSATQEPILLKVDPKEDSTEKCTKATVPHQRNRLAKISKTRKRNSVKDAVLTIDGVM